MTAAKGEVQPAPHTHHFTSRTRPLHLTVATANFWWAYTNIREAETRPFAIVAVESHETRQHKQSHAKVPVCTRVLSHPRSCAFIKPSAPKEIYMKKLLIVASTVLALSTIAVRAADANENWDKTCTKCHGPDGKGKTKMGEKLGIKDLTDPKIQAEATDEKAFKAIKEGLKDSEGKIKMKPAENLSDDDIKALVAKFRTLKK
jgi:cytochrome c553